jgi:hypothetical protein
VNLENDWSIFMTYLSNAALVKGAGNTATVLFAIFIGIQLLLATGILPVSIAWGGRQTELTPALRVASIVAVFILGAFIYIIRYRAGLIGTIPAPTAIRVMAWVVTAFMSLNTVGNFASVNSIEKLLFGPITIVITIACLIVSASRVN